MSTTKTPLNEVDFVEGILTVAASRGHSTFNVEGTRLDLAMAAAYERLRELLSDSDDLEVEFEVRPDPIFGDSPTIKSALNVAVVDRHIRRINPPFRPVEITLVVEPDAAQAFLRRLPGRPELYEELAQVFLRSYAE